VRETTCACRAAVRQIGWCVPSRCDQNGGWQLWWQGQRAAYAELCGFCCAQVQGQTGIGALALRLNHILVEHIRALLPSLRAHLEEALERRQKELKKYGAMPPGSTSAARYVLNGMTSAVSASYLAMLPKQTYRWP
jgi:Dynamin central region